MQFETQTFARIEASSGAADAVGSIRAIARFRGATYLASYGRGDHQVKLHFAWN